MTLDRPLELMREAVNRHGHKCSICGRPCGEDEARRHTEPGAFGDSSMSFAAMCYACQTWLAHEGAKPAQYVTHFYDAPEASWRWRRLTRNARKLIVAVGLITFAAASILIHQTTWNSLVAATLLLLFVYTISTRIFDYLRHPGPRLYVHHTYEREPEHVEQQR